MPFSSKAPEHGFATDRLQQLTSAGRNMEEPEGDEHADIQKHREYEERSAQDVVIREQDEGLSKTEAGTKGVLQREVLLPHHWPARRVLMQTHASRKALKHSS